VVENSLCLVLFVGGNLTSSVWWNSNCSCRDANGVDLIMLLMIAAKLCIKVIVFYCGHFIELDTLDHLDTHHALKCLDWKSNFCWSIVVIFCVCQVFLFCLASFLCLRAFCFLGGTFYCKTFGFHITSLLVHSGVVCMRMKRWKWTMDVMSHGTLITKLMKCVLSKMLIKPLVWTFKESFKSDVNKARRTTFCDHVEIDRKIGMNISIETIMRRRGIM